MQSRQTSIESSQKASGRFPNHKSLRPQLRRVSKKPGTHPSSNRLGQENPEDVKSHQLRCQNLRTQIRRDG
jgi:hypothetical protein